MLKLKLQYLATWCEEVTHWKRPWCWERLRAGDEGCNRGWDDWMALPTQWTWVWASSGRWWRTGKPGVLQSMGSQRARHNLVSEQQQCCWVIDKTRRTLRFLRTSYDDSVVRWEVWAELQQARTSHLLRVSLKPPHKHFECCPLWLLSPS